MPPSFSTSLATAVRAHLSLTQANLTLFIGVSRTFLAHVEDDRKELPKAARHCLQVLSRLLPPPNRQDPLPRFQPPTLLLPIALMSSQAHPTRRL